MKTWLYYKFTTRAGVTLENVLVLQGGVSRLCQRRIAAQPTYALQVLRSSAIPEGAAVDAFACGPGELPQELEYLKNPTKGEVVA